jgi:hypothetical protein
MTHHLRELLEGMTAEMAAASSPFLTLPLEASQAMTLLTLLQLALRHPEVTPTVREQTEIVAEILESQLASLGPNTRECCRMGWQETADFDAA